MKWSSVPMGKLFLTAWGSSEMSMPFFSRLTFVISRPPSTCSSVWHLIFQGSGVPCILKLSVLNWLVANPSVGISREKYYGKSISWDIDMFGIDETSRGWDLSSGLLCFRLLVSAAAFSLCEIKLGSTIRFPIYVDSYFRFLWNKQRKLNKTQCIVVLPHGCE